jgi:hypothetical protein
MQDCITCNRRTVTGNLFDSNFEGQQKHMFGAAQHRVFSTSNRGMQIPL